MNISHPAGSVIERLVALSGANAGFVMDLYDLYRGDPEAVAESWRSYFRELEGGEAGGARKPVAGPEAPPAAPAAPPLAPGETLLPLRGGLALIVRNMEASRDLPTATSYRRLPVKVLEENRRLLNHYLELKSGPKISFTHLIAWAVLRALEKVPVLNDAFAMAGGEPHRIRRTAVHLGMAVDMEKKDGTRTLLVPNLRDAGALDFRQFVDAYTRLIEEVRAGRLGPDAFQGTTISITNPGTVGTESSVPRLMPGQGAIIAVGSIGYSAEARAMSPELLSRLGMSKSMTVSCTYDHRIVQGAESGEFLGEVERLLRGEDGFYDGIYRAMGVPYQPVRWTPDVGVSSFGGGAGHEEILRQARVLQLINAYRVRGHLLAHLDPLGEEPAYHPELDPGSYGLTLWDLDRRFITGATGDQVSAWEEPQAPLREILQVLRNAYCGRMGVEYMNIQDPEQKRWIQERVEPESARAPLPEPLRLRALTLLASAEAFERYLHAKFVGHKRFSLEGGETLIPVVDMLIEEAAREGVEEVVMGMAHRGRLNMLSQIIKVDYANIFSEFQGNRDPHITQGSGDVKYHLGATGTHRAQNGREVRIVLAPNPSHLEAVDPVVEGIARAKQERFGAEEGRRRVLPVLVHGDAAFAGQGMVAETLNLSQLKGYRTGGTVHLIVNNQIGFTTPVESARSSAYSTDIAKMVQAPIFHVNGDDPEAAMRAVRIAFAFRQAFRRDVVVDIVCYRRHGHNEGDEPSYTQPRLYARIRNHPSVAALYGERLEREGVVDAAARKEMERGIHACLELSFEHAQKESCSMRPAPIETPQPRPGAAPLPRPTAVPAETLRRIAHAVTSAPENFDLHPKLRRWMEDRRKVIGAGEGIDWSFAETLAFGSLVLEGTPVRLSGQDSVRGTFSQRHLLLHDDADDSSWMALQHLDPAQAPFWAVDSPLSEEAVLGFEYGFSLGDPTALVLWEAQFGDFVNEAQPVIDQFLAGAKAKWGQPSGLVLLLPHGYEGQGPDHSSARLERFLQLAAEDNLQVANCTTPAQLFHLLRRQICEEVRIPLVLMTPKSILRHPGARSALRVLSEGRFEPMLPDPAPAPPEVRRLLLCSGKIAYDLLEERGKREGAGIALARVELLYPFPETAMRETLAAFPEAEVVWVQEEPRNMGAWRFMEDHLRRILGEGRGPRYIGRAESASTATGYLETHRREQRRILEEALTP